MATLQDLVNQISASSNLVKLVDPNQDYGYYKFYTVYWKRDVDTVDSEAICIYIDNRGTPTETAYFKGTKPQVLNIPAPTPFTDGVKSKIADFKAANPNVEKVEIVSVDEQNQLAIMNAYVYDSTTSTSTKKTVAAYMLNGQLTYRILK